MVIAAAEAQLLVVSIDILADRLFLRKVKRRAGHRVDLSRRDQIRPDLSSAAAVKLEDLLLNTAAVFSREIKIGVIGHINDCLFVRYGLVIDPEILVCQCVFDCKFPVARETGISIGKVDRKCDAVLPDLRVEQPLVKHLIGVKVVSLFVHRQMVLHPVNDKRCACDPVRAGTHYRTEARRIIQIVFHVVKPQNDVLHDPVPVRRLEAHQDCSQICYRCAQAVCADRIERNLSSVAEFSKKFFSDSHFAPSSIF